MSKSIGNVVDPELVTDGSLRHKALGADGLRLWVALAGAESAGESRIGEKALADIDKKVVRDFTTIIVITYRLLCSETRFGFF